MMAHHNVITKEAAKKIESKLLRNTVNIAAFKHPTGLRTIRVTDKHYDEYCEAFPERLVGVYTATCPLSALEDDLAEAGIR